MQTNRAFVAPGHFQQIFVNTRVLGGTKTNGRKMQECRYGNLIQIIGFFSTVLVYLIVKSNLGIFVKGKQ